MDGTEVLPTLYSDSWAAEEAAAVIAVQLDVLLYLGDDEIDREMAQCLCEGVLREDEAWEKVYGWQR